MFVNEGTITFQISFRVTAEEKKKMAALREKGFSAHKILSAGIEALEKKVIK